MQAEALFGMMCVGVTLWFVWGGVVSGCRLKLINVVFICVSDKVSCLFDSSCRCVPPIVHHVL